MTTEYRPLSGIAIVAIQNVDFGVESLRAQGRCRGLNFESSNIVFPDAARSALPIHLLRHFCGRMHRLSHSQRTASQTDGQTDNSWVIITGDGRCSFVLPTGGLTAQVRRLGPKAGGRLVLFCIHRVNRVNSRNDCYRVMMTAP